MITEMQDHVQDMINASIGTSKLSTITNSELSTLKRCERYHYYRYVMLRSPPRDAKALEDGDQAHKWLEDFWKGNPVRRAPASPMVQAMVAGYDARYQDASAYEVLGVEKQLVFSIDEDVRIALKLDGLVKRRSDGKIFVLEHKTSSLDTSAGSDYWRSLRLDTQISTYMLACKCNGIDVDGVIYDVLSRPRQRLQLATPEADRKYTKEKPATKNKPAEPSRLYAGQRDTDETEDEFFSRLCQAIGENPDAYYQREIITKTDEELTEAAHELREWALRSVMNASRRTLPVRNNTGCLKWGRLCEYFDVCTGARQIQSMPLLDRKHQELELED